MNVGTDTNSEGNTRSSDIRSGEVLREWRESAFYWQKHYALIRRMFQPATQALVHDSGMSGGQAVLDIAGGSGEPSLTIAKTVGSTGSVTCTDVTPEMVAAAETEAQRRGLRNVNFQQCSAESLPFESESFDVVVCRLGIMFFPDPLAALREMLRVTIEGGVLSLAVWARTESNPFFSRISEVVDRHFPGPPPDPNALGAFRFAESGVLSSLLKEAGAMNIKERVLAFNIAAPISLSEFWEMRSETSGTLRQKLASLTSEQRALVAGEVQKAVSEFFPNGEMSFPAQMIIVTGGKAK